MSLTATAHPSVRPADPCTARRASVDIPITEDLADDIHVLVTEDDLAVVLGPKEGSQQLLWLDMVDARAPHARYLGIRLLAALQSGETNVIRLSESMVNTLMEDHRQAELQIQALVHARLAAIRVRHFLDSEVVLVLSDRPGDSM